MVVGALTYASSLSKPFIADDLGAVIKNTQIRDLTHLSQVFAPPANSPLSGRPIVNLSLAINYAIGGLDVTGYHVVNVALHLVCGVLVFGIARQIFALSWTGAWLRGRSADLALAAALIWTVHPLNSEVVDYITQRTESMMAACYLLTMYASLRARESERRAGWVAAAWAACAIGTACKETMVTVPVAVVLVDATLVYGTWAGALRERWRFYAGLGACWIVLFLVVGAGGQTWTAGFSSAKTTPWNYLLNQSVMIARYLRLAIWPSDLVLNYGWTKAVTFGQVWPSFAFVSALAIVVLVLLWTRPRLACAGAFVFLTLAPTSSIVPIATEVGAERRMYLPMVALVMLAVAAARWLQMRSAPAEAKADAAAPTSAQSAATILLAALVAVLAIVTIRRTSEYSSALVMARTMVERWPSANAHQMLGTELAAAGQHAEALAHLRLAADDYPPARYFLGTELLSQGQVDEGLRVLQAFVRDEPELPVVPDVRVTIAQVLASKEQVPQAIEQLTLALSTRPGDLEAHALMADLLVDQRRFDEAIAHYRTVRGRALERAARLDGTRRGAGREQQGRRRSRRVSPRGRSRAGQQSRTDEPRACAARTRGRR